MMENGPIDELVAEWTKQSNAFETLESSHAEYSLALDALTKRQIKEKKDIKETRAKLGALKDAIKHATSSASESDKARMADVIDEMADCKTHMNDMEQELPRDSNGVYLSIILGSTLDVSLMSKNERFRYKDEYEKFKLSVTIVVIIAVTLTYLLATLRVTDALTHFVLVWYYCTLTIRESILRVNGSKIKGWWVYHHFVSTVLCGTMLTWPDSTCYRQFRTLFLGHAFYIGLVQLLQVQYQRGCLRRLRALGQRHEMDVTVEGFHSWMFKGLTFLLPFLFVGYALQLYNALYLFHMYATSDCAEYQVWLLGVLFLVIAVGNTVTTLRVVVNKLASSTGAQRRRLTSKYSTTPSRSGKAPAPVDDQVYETVFRESEDYNDDKKTE